jgi:hypothetical protein
MQPRAWLFRRGCCGRTAACGILIGWTGNWLDQTQAAQLAALAALDAAAFAAGGELNPWRKLKALILTGYYTSREGGAQELQYAAIPGRFDPRVPVGPDARGFSSDWTGVDFG